MLLLTVPLESDHMMRAAGPSSRWGRVNVRSSRGLMFVITPPSSEKCNFQTFENYRNAYDHQQVISITLFPLVWSPRGRKANDHIPAPELYGCSPAGLGGELCSLCSLESPNKVISMGHLAPKAEVAFPPGPGGARCPLVLATSPGPSAQAHLVVACSFPLWPPSSFSICSLDLCPFCADPEALVQVTVSWSSSPVPPVALLRAAAPEAGDCERCQCQAAVADC